MSSHHRGTPHISDVHSVKSIVCLQEHVWESAHECSNALRDGCGLNKQSTVSQVFEPHQNILCQSHAAELYCCFSCSAFFFSFFFNSNMFLQISAYTTKYIPSARRRISRLTAEKIKDVSLICSSCEWTGLQYGAWNTLIEQVVRNVCRIKRMINSSGRKSIQICC